ncbi:hypothetical protein [Nonomuraea sp. NPDC049646]|uniref:hypothetical protein n=1 Tax=unclassified Nonomuraea TaxID=2593643 RepID=UPI0037966772
MFLPRRVFRLAAGAAAGYLLAVRPWHLRWGATDKEVHEDLPGDDIVPLPQLQATRAVTVDAPPPVVWAWVVRLGGYPGPGPRPGTRPDTRPGAGADAWAAAAGEPPQPPHDLNPGALKPGDVMDGGAFVVERIEAPHSLVLADRGADATTTCSIALRDTGGGTRLIYRLRMRGEPTVRGAAHVAMTDVGDFVAMRRQLLAVKTGAESAR